jgi:hypothetical protein
MLGQVGVQCGTVDVECLEEESEKCCCVWQAQKMIVGEGCLDTSSALLWLPPSFFFLPFLFGFLIVFWGAGVLERCVTGGLSTLGVAEKVE